MKLIGKSRCRLLTVFLCVMLMFSLSACGDTEEKASSVESDKSNDTEVEDTVGQDNNSEEEEAANAENAAEEDIVVPLKLMVQTKSHSDFTDDDSYTSLYNGNYDLIYLTDDCKEVYGELSKSLEAFNEEKENDFLSDYKESLAEAEDYYNESEDKEYFYGYSDEAHITLCRADELFLSISRNFYSYRGGAHGIYGSGGYNYDVKTGMELQLNEVITDIPALQKLVIEKLKEEYSDIGFDELDVSLEESVPEYLTGEKDQACSWFITPRGIKITFGVYQLASYAAGEQTVFISYDEHPELFYEGFRVQTGNYIEDYDSIGRFNIDIGDNGSVDTVEIEGNYNDNSDIESVTINVNGVKTSADIYGFDLRPRFVHMGQSVYLYLEVSQENDYRSTYAFKLSEGGAIKIGEYYGYLTGIVPYADYDSDWNSYWSVLLTVPTDLYFGERMQILSTFEGIAKAVINDNGELVLPEEYYYSDFSGTITAKQDVKANEINEETKEVTANDSAIPSGTKLSIVGTDGKSIVDLKAESGTVYQLDIKADDWPQTVNGVDIEELFDGIMFAG